MNLSHSDNMPTQIRLSAPLNLATITQPQLVAPQPPLEQVTGLYLAAKALEADKHYLSTIKSYLRDLISSCGSSPIDNATSAMIQQAIFTNSFQPTTRKAMLKAIQALFRWSRSEAYLPVGVPTAADSITIQISRVPLPILSPGLMERLLWCANDVAFRVAIALRSFSNLQHSDLPVLDWENCIPGRTIVIQPGKTSAFGSMVPICPVLDAWLRPFYGRKGSIFSSKDWHRLRSLAPIQGVACDARLLRRSYLAYASVLSGRGGPHHPLATPALARDYFSLTPDRVGITNWPEMVAEYLRESQMGARRT